LMRELRVRELRWEARGVLSLVLSDPCGAPLPGWTPGAHVTIEVCPGLERQYSLCGDPEDATQWRVAVLHEPQGRGGSAFVHERLRPGDHVRAREPRNDFALVPAAEYRLIAGGIGITPILPMIDALALSEGPWRLLYGGRRRDSMAFLDRLVAYESRVTVVPEDECGLLDLDAFLDPLPTGAAVYCCGPASLLEAVEERVPPGALHLERFTPLMDAAKSRTGDEFEVQLVRSDLTLKVPDGSSILEVVEAAGVAVACSCLEGTCGTCETEVLDGRPDHRDAILTERERASGATMMICVSRSLTPSLRLDL
jgi:ferredoxin-NADP reductase